MKRGDIKIIVGVVLLVLISYGVVFVKGMGVDQNDYELLKIKWFYMKLF